MGPRIREFCEDFALRKIPTRALALVVAPIPLLHFRVPLYASGHVQKANRPQQQGHPTQRRDAFVQGLRITLK